MMTPQPSEFDGIYRADDALLTKNTVPGTAIYGEELVMHDGTEYRAWNPHRSKLAAYLLNGGTVMPLTRDARVLYLGAASGTTISHVADIAEQGTIYGVEFAPRVARDLLDVAERRTGIIPILADANRPTEYMHMVGSVDVLYQDVAQKNQTEIFIKNAARFLKDGGIGMLMLKAKSIDIAERPETLFNAAADALTKRGFTISDARALEPYQKDHQAIVVKK